MSAAVLPLLGVPAVTTEARAAGEVIEGQLQRTWLQHASDRVALGGPLSWIRTDEGSVRVHSENFAQTPVGATVRVTLGGDDQDAASFYGGFVRPRAVVSKAVVQSAPAPTTQTAHEVLVVGAVRQGRTPDADLNDVQNVVDALNGPVHDYWDEQSDGAVRVAATAWPAWITTASDCTDIQGVWDEVAQAVGFPPGPGKHLMIYGAGLGEDMSGCSYGDAEEGNGRGSGGLSYVRTWNSADLAHALGHNFGLGDSVAETCMVASPQDCRTDPGGDWYDPMGADERPLGSLSPPHAARLGLLPAGQRQVVDSSAFLVRDYTLLPAGGRSGPRTIELTHPGTSTRYWLEYRPATGRDAWLGTQLFQPVLQSGVLVRQTDDGKTPVLLDPTPTSVVWSGVTAWETERQVAAPIGEEFPVGTFWITVVSQSASGAVVRVTASGNGMVGDDRCDRSRPTAPLAGVAFLGDGGGTTALAVRTDRALWARPIDGTASSWVSLGGSLRYGPAATVAGTTSYVFGVGTDSALWYRERVGSTWSRWRSLGGALAGSPAAASLGAGHLRVVGRAPDGSLYSRELRSGSWSGWTKHGGVFSSPPTATADLGSGRVLITGRAGTGYLYDLALAAGARTASYQRRAVLTCSALALNATRSPGDPGDGVYLDLGGAPWLLGRRGSLSLGGRLTGNPAVRFEGTDVLVAGRGADGALWLYDGRAGGNRWVFLGGRI